MTTGHADYAADAEAPAGAVPWRLEMRAMVKLALPIALTQLGQVAMMTSDLMLIGRLGDRAIAGAALAHIIMFACFVVGMGLMSAVSPLAAQAYGAREPRMVRRALRVGLWAALMIGAPMTAAMFYGETFLLALGQDPEAARLAGQYLIGLGWCLVPGWWFIALRGFMSALNRPEPALWITIVAVPANLLLAYALIYGEFGMPRLEMFGAGIATTIVNLFMCTAALWIAYTQRPFRKYQVLGRFWRMDWPLMGQLFLIGSPIAGSFLLEYGMFAVAAILMGWIGTIELAAHQIALQVASILFMAPFGISMAATVRVGHAVGRRNAPETRRAGFAAIALGAAFMATMVVLILLTRHWLPLAFLDGGNPDADATLALAATLLAAGATFFIADGVQTIAAGALRGLSDTRIPLLFATLSFWIVGFGTCYTLAFPVGLGALGVWIGFTVGLVLYAVLLVWRFNMLTTRGYMPDAPGHAHA